MPYNIGKLKYWQGRKLSASHKLKIKKSLAKSKMKRSRLMKQLFSSGKIVPYFKGKHLPLSVRQKVSATKTKQCSTPAFRKKTSLFFKRYWKEHPDKLRENLNKTIYLWKKNPALRAKINKKISIAGKKRFSDEKERIRMRKSVKEFWENHPELKPVWRKRFLNYFLNDSDARKNLLKNQKNPFDRDIKTKSGYFVRSAGEKKIADFLSSNKIKFEYETQPLLLKKHPCIPDFWLSDFRILIEFYGGYPSAWKKKVLKNKLYKKYKIPCIFITPAELLDLDYYLLKEIGKLKNTSFDIRRFQK